MDTLGEKLKTYPYTRPIQPDLCPSTIEWRLDAGLMRGMASVTGESVRLIGGHDLRKCVQFGAVGFVTAGAYHSHIQLGGRNRCRILGVKCHGSVASLARNHQVLPKLFLIYDIGVAPLADLMSRKGNRASSDLPNGISR